VKGDLRWLWQTNDTCCFSPVKKRIPEKTIGIYFDAMIIFEDTIKKHAKQD
jgi:hypothetical protein